ncbi:MAG TPA: dihydrolipoamide acetyltransferase family protein [Gemmatimonadota bacterium]|nr:dihydrolipoamide acetyltransferase family protein [Gemmatimonadota bacterium]
MPIDVIMPQMGESIAEGTLVKWLKKPGEHVERDENLFEISTDKVDAEIPSPSAGTLGEILVQEGETVEVGTVVATILAAGEGQPAAAPAKAASSQADGSAQRSVSSPGPAASAPAAEAPASGTAPDALPAVEAAPAVAVPSGDGAGNGSAGPATKEELRRTRSSPLVRNIAREHGVDISQVRGSGLSGRVTKRDILAYIAQGEAGIAPAAAGPERAPEPAGAEPPRTVPQEPARAVPIERLEPAPVAAAGPAPRPYGDNDRVELEPMSTMRQRIAERMIASRRTSAHVTSFFEIDMTRVDELRRRNKESFLADSGVKLTFMPFIIKALVAGVKEWPILNSSVWNDQIVYKKDINVGIAVALKQERGFGLLVPVIRHADELSLVGLARAANDLAERARTKRLSPDEVQGGTITITNPGVFGSLAGTPIINQPQVAILGVGAIEKRVKVVGPNDSIGVRTCAYFSISYDHRVVDGATADHFMLVVKEKLESFSDPSLK